MFTVDSISDALLQRRRAMQEVNPTSDGKKIPHPAARAPRLFADTAKIDEIKPLFEAGIINGVTTNPSLLKAAGAESWDGAKRILADLLKLVAPGPVHLELTKVTPDEMIEQAEELHALGDNGIIKIPVGGYQAVDPSLDPHTGLHVIRALWERDIRTNATLVFNSTQAFWAANAGAGMVSPFLGRVADYLYANDDPERASGNALYYVADKKDADANQQTANTEYVAGGGAKKDAGVRLIRECAAIFANYDIHTEILAASVRNGAQLSELLLAGVDILTVPANLLQGVADHPLSSAGFARFDADAKAFEE
jgi:transaldolase